MSIAFWLVGIALYLKLALIVCAVLRRNGEHYQEIE